MNNKPTRIPKGRYRLRFRGTECLNCGHPLDMSDKYCPSCSQANSTKKLSLKDFFDEFFSNIISYDSKLLRTLSALLLRPGRITKDYVKGRRVSYTNPFRFLLSLAIIYFLMLNYTGNFTEWDRFGDGDTGPFSIADDIPLTIDLNGGELNEDEKKEALQQLDSLGIPQILGNATKDRDSVVMLDPKGHFKKLGERTFLDRLIGKQTFFQTMIKKKGIRNFGHLQDTLAIAETYENKITFNTAKSVIRAEQRPGSFFNDLIAKLPFLVFFFLPVFALFIWLIYTRKKYNYTDHLIFSFHNQSLLFILLIINFIIDYIFSISTSGIFLLIFSFYLYKSMRKFYGEGRFKTIVKYTFLNTIFFILAIFSLVLLLAGSVFTY